MAAAQSRLKTFEMLELEIHILYRGSDQSLFHAVGSNADLWPFWHAAESPFANYRVQRVVQQHVEFNKCQHCAPHLPRSCPSRGVSPGLAHRMPRLFVQKAV